MYFEVGDTKGLSADVVDGAGDPANALTVTLTITKPDGTTVTPTVTSPPAVTGHYVHEYPLTLVGPYSAAWLFTFSGGLTTAHSEDWYVNPIASGAMLSLDDAKQQLNITSTTSDDELRPFLSAVTAVIERHTGKAITRRTVTERVSASYASELWLSHRPILSITSIATVDGLTTWPVTSTYLDVNADWGRITRLSGNYWTGSLLVTYVAGMSVVPANYTMAARIIVQHLWQTQRGQRGGPRVGGIDPGLPGLSPGSGFAIPNAALELLGAPGPMVA